MNQRPSTPGLSVVIPCLGHARELAECLRGLVRGSSTDEIEIVVVDSAADPEVADAASLFPGVRLIRGDRIMTPGAARNLGVRHARSAHLAFLDADCEPDTGWVSAADLHARATARLAGGPVLDGRSLHPVAAADHFLSFPDCGPLRPSGPVPHLAGCNLALSRETFEALGGFPEEPAIGEDALLAIHAHTRWPEGLRFERGLRVHHRGRTRLSAFWRHQERLGFARGSLGTALRPPARLVGHRREAVPLVALWRLAYVFRRTVMWNPGALPRLVLFLPLVLIGLLAWAIGFRRGRSRAREESW